MNETAHVALNPTQLEAVNAIDRNLLIVAGPGAGKSAVLCAHAAKLAERGDGRVIMLTFANRAAEVLQKRTRGLVAEGRPHAQVVARTVHAHAFDILTTHSSRLGISSPKINIIGSSEVRDIAERVAVDRNLPQVNGTEFASWLESLRRKNVALDTLPENQRMLLSAVEQVMCEMAAMDFGTVLSFATRLLIQFPEVATSVRRHDRYLLLDEAQDLDAGQLAFLGLLMGDETHLAVAIDPNQSLYRWRDADADLVIDWVQAYQPHTIYLTENFRCAPAIQAIGEHILHPEAPAPAQRAGGVTALWQFANENLEAEYVAQWVGQRVKEIGPTEVAVLARVGYRLTVVRQALGAADIPTREPGVAWSDEEAAILSLLRAASDWLSGSSQSSLRQVPYQLLGMDSREAADVEARALAAGVHPGDLISESAWMSVRSLTGSKRTPAQLVGGVAEILKAPPDSIARLMALATDETTLGSLMRAAARAPRDTADAASAVLVSSFHGAKGMQFQEVVIVGVEEGTVPSYRATGVQALKEERRALYVAATRAKDVLALSWVRQRGRHAQRLSSFLPPAESEIWTQGTNA